MKQRKWFIQKGCIEDINQEMCNHRRWESVSDCCTKTQYFLTNLAWSTITITSMMSRKPRVMADVISSQRNPLTSLQQHTGALAPPIPNLHDGHPATNHVRRESIKAGQRWIAIAANTAIKQAYTIKHIYTSRAQRVPQSSNDREISCIFHLTSLRHSPNSKGSSRHSSR